jgi:beta-glucosidase/6-phospho-beta-glucosidase/beta-galactosidase
MVPYIVLKMNAKIPERFYDEVLEDLEKNGRKLIIKFLDYDEPIIIEMTE